MGDSWGRAARWQPPRPSRCQSPASSGYPPEEDNPDPGVKAAPGGPGHRAPPQPPSLPLSLTYRPMRACQHCRFSHLRGWGKVGVSRASVETPSGRNNFRKHCILIGCSRGGGTEATTDWLAARGAGGTRLGGGAQAGPALGGPSASGACGERRAWGGRGLAPGSGPSAPRSLARAFHRRSPVLHLRCLPNA